MSNCMIAWPNRADGCTLSGGSWKAAMPLVNLQTRLMSQYARSSDATTASTKLVIALPQARAIALLALCNHNLSLTATYRVRAYSDAGLTVNLYDSGAGVNVFPTGTFVDSDDAWGNATLWNLNPNAALLGGLRATLTHVLPAAVTAQYWLVEITDTSNVNNYVQFGRLFLSEGFTPAVNMEYDAALSYSSRTDRMEAYDGGEYLFAKPAPRVAQFVLSGLSADEAMYNAFDMQRRNLDIGEIFYVYDKSDAAHLLRRSFLATLNKLSSVTQTQFSRYSAAFEAKERL